MRRKILFTDINIYFYVKSHNAIESMSRVRAPMERRSAKCPLLGAHTGDAATTHAPFICVNMYVWEIKHLHIPITIYTILVQIANWIA